MHSCFVQSQQVLAKSFASLRSTVEIPKTSSRTSPRVGYAFSLVAGRKDIFQQIAAELKQ